MGIIQWLNSGNRKNWHMVVLNIIMGIVMSIIIIPSVVYFTKVVPNKYEFSGFVIDVNTNEPVKGAQVFFPKIGVATTAQDGRFRIKNRFRSDQLPFTINDQISVEISAPGYIEFKENFELINFKMDALQYRLEKE